MIDFIVSIDAHSDELDGRHPWKIRYPLSTILFLVFVCQLAGIETRDYWVSYDVNWLSERDTK